MSAAAPELSAPPAPSADADRPLFQSRWLVLLLPVGIWLVLFLRPAVWSVLRPPDHDLWWHLRTGQWVEEHRTVPATDPFAQHGLETGKPWLAYSWLFEVTVYGCYQLLGYHGIILFRVLLTLAVLLALLGFVCKRERRVLVAALLLVPALLVFYPSISERPWLFTILGSLWTLDVLLDAREGRRTWRFWLLPVVYLVWANVHIQFVYGLFLLGLGCAAPLVDRLLGRQDLFAGAARAGSRAWWQLVAMTAACTAATLVNPYHFHLYGVVLEYGSHQAPMRWVDELKPMEFRYPSDWAVLAVGGAAAFALGRRARLSAFDVLLLTASAWFAFRMRRDGWFLMLAALAVLSSSRPLDGYLQDLRFHKWQVAAAALLLVPVLLAVWFLTRSGDRAEPVLAEKYPTQAVAFVRQQGYRGPLYNDFDWGGYLIWTLPELPVAMDGRTNLHGDERIDRAMATWLGQPGWEDDPELARANVVIARVGLPLTANLRRDPRFDLVHEDDVACVFVARTPAPAVTSAP
jgi:hypothetical protein